MLQLFLEFVLPLPPEMRQAERFSNGWFPNFRTPKSLDPLPDNPHGALRVSLEAMLLRFSALRQPAKILGIVRWLFVDAYPISGVEALSVFRTLCMHCIVYGMTFFYELYQSALSDRY